MVDDKKIVRREWVEQRKSRFLSLSLSLVWVAPAVVCWVRELELVWLGADSKQEVSPEALERVGERGQFLAQASAC